MGPGRLIAAAAAALLLVLASAQTAGAQEPPPRPDGLVTPEPCTFDGDRLERRIYELEGWEPPSYERYPGACERLRFAHGPLTIKPGQNDVLVEPVTIQAPRRDGYITRFEPNLVLPDGTVPPVEEVHLHHGTWLSDNAIYAEGQGFGGIGPFAAAGEEKTIASAPQGFGMPVEANDQWFLLYMVHSAVQEPMTAYITYEMDFIPEDKAAELGFNPAHTLWLDVRNTGYPVFNVQRPYGGKDGKCTWPDEQCADFDPYGQTLVGQGQPGQGYGNTFRLPDRGEPLGPIDSFTGGTLIGIAGHLHPGGLTDNVELVRDGRSKRIFTSEAIYWDHEDPRKPTGPPTSWDLSMTGTTLPFWGIRVEPGDELRISATYDTKQASTYENMGIAVGAIAPDTLEGQPTAPGYDPFKARRARPRLCETPFGQSVDRCRELVKLCTSVPTRLSAPGSKFRMFSRRWGLESKRPRVYCDRGIPTHGHQEANGNHGGPAGQWTGRPGSPTSDVAVANFVYTPGDLTTLSMTGVPQVKLGTKLRFTNVEGSTIYHSVTSCGFPCLGPTGASFPLPDGATSSGRQIDFDSSELGFGTPAIGPTKQRLDWQLPVTREAGYEPGETVTYFCRIHPSMRGAFQVTE